jgi:hypothetical protein
VVRGQPAKITDVKKDDMAVVKFGVAQDGSRFAKGVLVPKPTYAGKITAVISENAFTLTGKEKAWNVTLTPRTKIVSHGYVGTPADLQVGYFAQVVGDIEGDNIVASVVRFNPAVIKGVVERVNGYQFTVRTIRQKLVTVTASDATVVLIRPRTAPNRKGTPADVKPNTPINVGGHITGENAMQALWMDLLVAGPVGGQGAPAPGNMPRRGGRKR